MKHIALAFALSGVLLASLLVGAAASPAKTIQITHDGDQDAETSIAMNPRDLRNLVAGWISRGDSTCASGTSFDGGRTWAKIAPVPGIQKGSGGAFDVGTDPGVAFDPDGNAYYTCLGFDLFPPGTGSAGTIFVSKSTDGGLTWGTPAVAMQGIHVNKFQDHQFMTINPVTQAIYVTQTEFTAFGKPEILFTQSTDGGQSFAPPRRINRFSQGAVFQDSFSATGKDPDTIYIVYGVFSNAGLSNWNEIFLAKSGDGGKTFSPAQKLATVTPLPDPLPNSPWRSDNNLWIAVDRSTGQIYVNFADYRNGDADIWVMRVRDRGNAFVVEGVTRVNDDPVGNGADQFFPFVTVAPNGRVDVCFQDRRYSPGNRLLFVTCAQSTDGGLTFANVQATTEGFDAGNNTFIGDYNWQVSTNRLVIPIFVGDGVPGGDSTRQEVFIARVER